MVGALMIADILRALVLAAGVYALIMLIMIF